MIRGASWQLKLGALISLQNACPGHLVSSRNPGCFLPHRHMYVVCGTYVLCWMYVVCRMYVVCQGVHPYGVAGANHVQCEKENEPLQLQGA